MITAVTTCMGRRNHLEMTLPLMLQEFDHVIVVDWSCPQDSGTWAVKQGAEVVYQRGEKHFNVSRARNVGALRVKSRSLCFVDADVLVMSGIKAEIEENLNLSTMVLASRTSQNVDVTSLTGFIALDIGQFWGVGGYDETLEGYALEDCHLRARLCLDRGVKAARLSPGALGALRHGDDLRGMFYSEPIHVSAKRNRELLFSYMKRYGVTDWTTDPRTAEIAWRQ